MPATDRPDDGRFYICRRCRTARPSRIRRRRDRRMEPAARQLRESLRNKLSTLPRLSPAPAGPRRRQRLRKSLGAHPDDHAGLRAAATISLQLALGGRAGIHPRDSFRTAGAAPYFARMKQLNHDGAPVTGGPSDPPRLDAETFSRTGVRIVDTRDDGAVFDAALCPAPSTPRCDPPSSRPQSAPICGKRIRFSSCWKTRKTSTCRRLLYRIGFDRIEGWITAAEAGGLLTERIPRIEFADLIACKKTAKSSTLRTAAEFQRGHLQGARSFPIRV